MNYGLDIGEIDSIEQYDEQSEEEIYIDHEAFISYRHTQRQDLPGHDTRCNDAFAQSLYDVLKLRYGIDCFRDSEELHFGEFRSELVYYNKHSSYLVLLLTPGALDRCVNKEDWIRKEISLFLKRKKPILPVLINGFSFDELSSEVKNLPFVKEVSAIPERVECTVHTQQDLRKEVLKTAQCVYRFIRRSTMPPSKEDLSRLAREKAYYSRGNLSATGYYGVQVRKSFSAIMPAALHLAVTVWGICFYGAPFIGRFVAFLTVILLAFSPKYFEKRPWWKGLKEYFDEYAFNGQCAGGYGFFTDIRDAFLGDGQLLLLILRIAAVAAVPAFLIAWLVPYFTAALGGSLFLPMFGATTFTTEGLPFACARMSVLGIAVPCTLYRIVRMVLAVGHVFNARMGRYPHKIQTEARLNALDKRVVRLSKWLIAPTLYVASMLTWIVGVVL